MTQVLENTTTAATALRCKECGERYPIAANHVCEECFGPLEVEYDFSGLDPVSLKAQIEAGPKNLWRYAPLLPAKPYDRSVQGVGFTPLQRAYNLGAELGLDELYVKNDALNPTHSFKDRVVAIATAKAIEFGFDTIACASTGNLAGAVAAAGTRAGLKTYVFVPSNIEPGKILQASIYGATIVPVDGTYDDVNRLASQVADEFGWAFVNINMRPFYSEGSRTLAYETAEQLGWRLPDHVVIPIASGSLYTKITKGFEELIKIGLVKDQTLPAISGAQAQGCNPVAAAFAEHSKEIIPVKQPTTIAHSLAIGSPADGFYSLKIAQQTGGTIEQVTDEEIVDAVQLLARTEGIFTEPAGGVTLATLRKLARQGKIGRDEVTVLYITGNGLKTQSAFDGLIPVPAAITPKLGVFEKWLGQN
ncbi:MAG: threonine synthase [Chloroflexi bacterium]|nr:threonine synthase [Chloroflexota bacterium]OJW04144.1 MAG: threonine synthase [Chloroflexi bacterium 54-19]